MAKLRQECVQAKEALSSDTETTIPVLLPNRHFSVRLTRREFEGMVRAPIESTIGTMVRAVRSAHLDVDQLSAVLLVGGSSRIPLVERMIAEELGRPTVVDAHPKYSVALGAAMVAGRQSASPQAGPAAAADAPGAAAAAAPEGATVDPPSRPAGQPEERPPAPVFPSPSSGAVRHGDERTVRRRRRLGTAAAIAAALVVGGLGTAYAISRNPGAAPQSLAPSNAGAATSRTSPSHSSASPSTTAPRVTGTAALLKCPTSLPEYGCITRAVFDGKKLDATYKVNFLPTDPHHLHLFTANIEYGRLEPDVGTIGSQVPLQDQGNWYTEWNPPVFTIYANVADRTVSNRGQRLDTHAKYLCIRVADAIHMLIRDPNGGYDTGNCVPITR